MIPRGIIGKRHDPTLEKRITSHKDRLALWLKLFYLLVFREDRISALAHSPFPFYFLERKVRPCALGPCQQKTFLQGDGVLSMKGKADITFKIHINTRKTVHIKANVPQKDSVLSWKSISVHVKKSDMMSMVWAKVKDL